MSKGWNSNPVYLAQSKKPLPGNFFPSSPEAKNSQVWDHCFLAILMIKLEAPWYAGLLNAASGKKPDLVHF